MEVMITVAIIGILSAIAVPSYNSYITDSRRNEAKNSLLELGQFMERYYTANSSYVGAVLPFNFVPKDGGTVYYNVSIVASTDDSYELALIPTGPMDGDLCGNYTLRQTGEHSPTSTECW